MAKRTSIASKQRRTRHARLLFASMLLASCGLARVGFAQEEAPSTPPALPETEVVGEVPEPAPEEFSPFDQPPGPGDFLPGIGSRFQSPAVEGYHVPSSTAGTIIDIPLIEYPGSIDPIPRDVIDDQQALRIDELLRNSAGAAPAFDPIRPDTFILRGFELRTRDFRKNGFLDPTLTPRDFANVERIDILKGPSSFLYGAGQPSGMVNVITKKPLGYSYHHADATIGSWDLERYTVDSTAAMNESGTLLYRFNAAYENRNSFRDFYFNEREFFSPVVTWLIDERTQLTFEAEYLNDRRRYDTGLVAIDNNPFALPSNRFLGEPDNDFAEFHDYRATLTLTHDLSDDWTLYVGGSTLFYDLESSTTLPVANIGPTPFGDNTLLRARQDIDPSQEQNHALIVNLAGDYYGAWFDHKLLFGVEQNWFVANEFYGAFSDPTNPATTLAIDANNPVYNNPLTGLPDPAIASEFTSAYRQNRHGFYLQDLVQISDRWQLLAGVRWDIADVTFQRELTPLIPPTRTEQTYYRTTPRVGAVYQPWDETNLSFYATYSQSFDPPGGGQRLTTDPLSPETGDLWEGGVKVELVEDLTLVASGFYIEKENVTTDRFTGAPPFFVTSQVGRQRSQGAELSLLGQITEPWSVIANYTYIDARNYDPSDPSVDGKRVRNVPLNSANFWTRYDIIQRRDETLGLAVGMVFLDDRLGDYNSPLVLPSFVRWDAGINYRLGRWDAIVYFENIFDEDYIANSTSAMQVYPGAPFNVRAQLGVTF